MRKFITAAAIALAAATAQADVKLPAIISDNMCLQANKALPIWGKADPGEQVTVTLGEQKQSATAGNDGKWMVMLHALPSGAGQWEMSVAGKNKLVVKNIVVGEVWVASGQSNMEFGFSGAHNHAEEQPKANYPKIRIFNLQKKVAFDPQWDCVGKWEECSPETVVHTSAVGYFFARDIHTKLGVPVGLIHTSWGGTPAQSWTSIDGLKASPELETFVNAAEHQKGDLPSAEQKYEKEQLPRWEAADKKWKLEYGKADAATKKAHPEPRRPNSPENNPGTPSVLYNGMIAPIVPFGIEGAIWYQGEANAGNPGQYRTLFPAMITDWRNHWSAANPDEKDFTFCFVQLANFMERKDEPVQDAGGWPGLREAQHMTLKLPNTGEAVIIDIGQADNIHPKDKMDVGKRLALAALKVTYHQDVVFSGPTFDSMTVEGSKARIKFANMGGGLTIAAAPSTQPGVAQAEPASQIKGFSIAGADKKFVWAEAKIDGDSVIVSSPEVQTPVAVRYAWANNPECNLYNKEGLPASPFRTDTWGEIKAAPARK
jgi:sialate O-acetylesterase